MTAPFDHDADFAAGDPRDFRIVDPDDWDVAPPEDRWLVCPPPFEPMPWRLAVPLGLVCAAWGYGMLLAAGWAIRAVEGWLR